MKSVNVVRNFLNDGFESLIPGCLEVFERLLFLDFFKAALDLAVFLLSLRAGCIGVTAKLLILEE